MHTHAFLLASEALPPFSHSQTDTMTIVRNSGLGFYCVWGVYCVFFEARVVANTLQEVEMDTAHGALMDF